MSLAGISKTVLRNTPRQSSGKHGESQHPYHSLQPAYSCKRKFGYFAENCSLAMWQRIVEQFPNHLESQHLQDSFKLWGQATLDRKFESQAIFWCKDQYESEEDHVYFVIRSIELRPVGSEWIQTWYDNFPMPMIYEPYKSPSDVYTNWSLPIACFRLWPCAAIPICSSRL